MREKFEDEADSITYRILKQADYRTPFRAYLILNIELFIKKPPVSLDERESMLIVRQMIAVNFAAFFF